MTHIFKDEVIDWLNGGKYEFSYSDTIDIWFDITSLKAFELANRVRKVDEYKHLREALKRGETIQIKHSITGGWLNIKHPDFTESVDKYRIKPKTKKMVQWLYRSKDDGNLWATISYFDVGIKPNFCYGTPIQPLPYTEIEIEE